MEFSVGKRITTAEGGILPSFLTPEYGAKLLVGSFDFSQGNENLQEQIYRYLHVIHPEWRLGMDLSFLGKILTLAEEEVEKVLRGSLKENASDRVIPMIHTDKFASGRRIKQASLGTEIERQVGKMAMAFEGNEKIARESCVAEIAALVIAQDLANFAKGGRPRALTRPSQARSARGDPWLSHAIYYGTEAHSTGIREYNAMFRDVADMLAAVPSLLHYSVTNNFAQVRSIYYDKHPQATITANGVIT